MNTIKLTDKELEYLRYLVSTHALTEEFENDKEYILTSRIVNNLENKLGVK